MGDNININFRNFPFTEYKKNEKVGHKRGEDRMAYLTVQEISSWLVSRLRHSGDKGANKKEERPHQHWDDSARASLVILWGLLIYPKLDPDLKPHEPAVDLLEAHRLFQDHLGTVDQWKACLSTLQRLDYIRFRPDGKIIAGTRLWTAVDASRMYPLFRRSVLYRKCYHDKNC